MIRPFLSVKGLRKGEKRGEEREGERATKQGHDSKKIGLKS